MSNFNSKLKEYEHFSENLDSYMPTLGSKIDSGKELGIEIGAFRAILKHLSQASLSSAFSCLTKNNRGT